MKEILDILEAYNKIDFTDRKAALATVVKVEGSSYRQPGARMLISDDGKLTGAISGGCLEGDALRKALLVMARGKPMLITYDTTDENDAQLGIGLGCNGIIHILIEPLDPDDPQNPVQLLKKIAAKRQRAVLITLFSMSDKQDNQPGTCMAYDENGVLSESLMDQESGNELISIANEALANRNSLITTFMLNDQEITAFAELVNPVISLVIAGAGNDVMPLVKFAGLLAWQITVLDGRPSYANCRRFPEAHQVLVADAKQALTQITIDEHTVFVLMTHNYNYDLAVLQQLISMKITYIGILGPKKKRIRLLNDLTTGGRGMQLFDNIYGPAGLDIGAETAEEIALSIIAEIKAVLAGKKGNLLRDKADAIHSRTTETKASGVNTQVEFQY